MKVFVICLLLLLPFFSCAQSQFSLKNELGEFYEHYENGRYYFRLLELDDTFNEVFSKIWENEFIEAQSLIAIRINNITGLYRGLTDEVDRDIARNWISGMMLLDGYCDYRLGHNVDLFNKLYLYLFLKLHGNDGFGASEDLDNQHYNSIYIYFMKFNEFLNNTNTMDTLVLMIAQLFWLDSYIESSRNTIIANYYPDTTEYYNDGTMVSTDFLIADLHWFLLNSSDYMDVVVCTYAKGTNVGEIVNNFITNTGIDLRVEEGAFFSIRYLRDQSILNRLFQRYYSLPIPFTIPDLNQHIPTTDGS